MLQGLDRLHRRLVPGALPVVRALALRGQDPKTLKAKGEVRSIWGRLILVCVGLSVAFRVYGWVGVWVYSLGFKV